MLQEETTIGKRKSMLGKIFKRSGVFWALILLIIIASLISPHFLKSKNLINVLRQISINGTVAIGMTMVILTGGIDLSVGSIVGAVAVIAASILKLQQSVVLAVLAALAAGTIIGGMNGIGITRGKIPPFIMTLGTMVAARGLAMIIANGSPVSWATTGIDFTFLGAGALLDIPTPVWLFVIILAIAAIILKYTRFGRFIYAVGDSREASRLSGINVRLVEFAVYAINGFLCGIAALVFISRLDVGQPTSGEGLELDAIAMVIIGGTSTFGGEGSVFGTLIGAAIIALLANILNLLGISPFIQQIVQGAIIVLAVLLERQRRK